MRKSTAFIIGIIALMTVFAFMWGSKDETQYGTIIGGIVTLTLGYMGVQTVNNGVTGKYWNNDKYEKEHGTNEIRPVTAAATTVTG
jgi:hypothetical protein